MVVHRVVADPSATGIRRTRRWAAVMLLGAGVVDLASAVTLPFPDRLGVILYALPLAVPQIAAALAALSGLALVLLSRGVRKGQRGAWRAAVVALAASAVLHTVKGFDVEEAALAAAWCAYLLRHRAAFGAPVDRVSARAGMLLLVVGGAVATTAGTVGLMLADRSVSLLGAVTAIASRLAGVPSGPVPVRADEFLAPALLSVGIGLAAGAGWLLCRPVVLRTLVRRPGDEERARRCVARWSRGTLDYFALRDDKAYFFDADTVVAYTVLGGVCLVSPDPIGPPDQRAAAWRAFTRFADGHGWSVAVIAADGEWLATYTATGMKALHIGDEGIVDCTTFSLDGGRFKGLRQAVNRVDRNGYRVTFWDPADVPPGLRAELEEVMRTSRRGDVERGFSMTLGRVVDSRDDGLLLAVCTDLRGRAVAFCQYVPAPGMDGYSLDLMRRDCGEHPNGLTDFVVVATIRHLAATGHRHLGLNFATMRAVLAGESGDGRSERVKRWALGRMSDSMQIESLWRYNAKYAPEWRPRYVVFDAHENMVAAAVAAARAESLWELPVVGRLFVPDVSRASA